MKQFLFDHFFTPFFVTLGAMGILLVGAVTGTYAMGYCSYGWFLFPVLILLSFIPASDTEDEE